MSATVSILVFSTAALIGSLTTIAIVAVLPSALRGSREIAGWSRWRKIRFTAVAVVFAAFATLLASWGALQPWNP